MSGRALAPGDPHHRLNFWLLVLCVVAITHGSLYPWTFREPLGGWQRGWHHLWSWWSRPLWTSTGDVVGNVLLFIPHGMLAWRVSMGWALQSDGTPGAHRRAELVFCLGAAGGTNLAAHSARPPSPTWCGMRWAWCLALRSTPARCGPWLGCRAGCSRATCWATA